MWNKCLLNENLTTEIKFRVIGWQSQMGKFDLFFGLHLGHRLYSHTHNLSKSLKSEKMIAASRKRLAILTISLFQSLRFEESFESFCNAVLKKIKELPFLSEPKLPRQRRAPDYSIISHFTSSSSNKQSDAYHVSTPRDYYRVIYYQALDSSITSLEERLAQPCFKAYENLESLLLKSLSNKSIVNEIEYVKCVYQGDLDVDQLVLELQMFKAIFQKILYVLKMLDRICKIAPVRILF